MAIKDKIKTRWKNYKSSLTKKTVLTNLWHCVLMVIGNASLAFGTAVFLLPFEIVTGGVSGLALILSMFLPIDTKLLITILTWFMFLIGLILLGVKFSLKTLISTIVYPPLVYLFGIIRDNNAWMQLVNDNTGMLLAGIFGGFFVGAGCGITFSGGGSTGGVDCISLALNKYTKIKASAASFIIDSSIILGGLISYKDFTAALIGVLSAFICATAIDRIFLGNSQSFIAFIVSSKYEEINEAINTKLERGTTLVHSEGGYTGNETKMIQVAFERKEHSDLQAIVAKIDPSAFMSIVHAYEVNGYGFKRLPSVKKKSKLKSIISNNIDNKK